MKTKSQTKVAMTYGTILGLTGAIVSLVFFFCGADPQSKYPGFISYVLTIIAIIYGVKNYRDQELGGFISYGQSLGTGVLIGLFSGIIMAVFVVLMFTVIDPGLTEKIMDTAQQKMADKSMSEEQMETSLKWARKFMSPPFLFIFSIISSVFMSFIFSLIISIFMKKEQNPFDNRATDTI